MLTNKVGRVLGFAGVVGVFALVQACDPAGSDDVNVKTNQALTPKGGNPPKGAPLPPDGYVVKWSKCSNWIEGDLRVRNNSRMVKVKNGQIPITRVEPVANGEDNHRRIKVESWPKPLKGGKGLEVATRTQVTVIKLGQIINTREPDGSIVQWVVSSWNLGQPTRGKDGRLAYQDTCFRNPAASGRDTAGRVAEGTELAATCVVEDMNAEYNALSAVYGWLPIINYATGKVPMANLPDQHPDYAYYEGTDGVAHFFSASGAALNDLNGTERDSLGTYFPGEEYCHFIVSNGYEVPGSKRPGTKSYPAPGAVNVKTVLLWRPVNPNVDIANDMDPIPADPVEEPTEPVDATVESTDTQPM